MRYRPFRRILNMRGYRPEDYFCFLGGSSRISRQVARTVMSNLYVRLLRVYLERLPLPLFADIGRRNSTARGWAHFPTPHRPAPCIAAAEDFSLHRTSRWALLFGKPKSPDRRGHLPNNLISVIARFGVFAFPFPNRLDAIDAPPRRKLVRVGPFPVIASILADRNSPNADAMLFLPNSRDRVLSAGS